MFDKIKNLFCIGRLLYFIIPFVDLQAEKNKESFVKGSTVLLWEGFNHLLWPRICFNCKNPIEHQGSQLCGNCWDNLLVLTAGQYCKRCGRDVSRFSILENCCPVCMGEEVYFDGIARTGIYKGALREMILSFKNGNTELGEIIGMLADSAVSASGFENAIDFFVPVPLHWSRRLSRGYNHSSLIVGYLKKRKGIKINNDLVRIKKTKMQSAMNSRAQRAKNVAGAFALRDKHKLDGSSVCLVDDIKTTGATLNECALTLKNNGVKKVFALVAAVAGQEPV